MYEVTNLNDDNNPGSLRYAVTQNSSATYRTVVFRVSGTIHLLSPLRISRANTTIAGQTAPGDGICLADHPVSITASNVIVRFIRFRMGDKNQNKGMVNGSGSDDTFGALSQSKLMVDHCTMSWSSDEACTVYRGDSTTLQWNIISEPLNYSYHFETGDTDFERHGYGGIWGGRHASFHHNLLAHCLGRMPRFDGSRNLAPNTAGQENADFRNNVLYNWGSYNTNGGEGGNYNIVNNYYKYGPSTATGSSGGVSIRTEILNPYKQTSSPVLPYGKYYLTGNYVESSEAVTKRNWLGVVMNGGTRNDTTLAKVTTPFDILAMPTQSATDAYEAVLRNAGASLPKRDALDQRIVNDVRNRTGAIIDVQGGFPHGTPYEQTVGAWPVLNSLPAPTDTDHDGMPDSWEINQGLNPNDPNDRNVRDASGYTALENYLNGIASVVTGVKAGTTRIGALVAYPNPASEQLTVAHPTAVRGARVVVYSFEGKKVAEFASEPGSQQTFVSLQSLTRGNYLLVYTGGTERLTTKIIKH
ncbi:pectate lyase [Hymenobacter cavernae]|uniref:Pectate lyase n=1 Tax=Hymenobacter cavernae TaxID=2044852 RepID=A0ABQ1TQZ4_9BACT|nr:pectate lyase [Hymenobacter cavernae]